MFPLRQLAMTAILGCVVSTVSVDAQTQGRISDVSASTPRTHVVRAGDTLWDLARTYLGDPHRWQVLYRLNWGVVPNPHWLEPGMVLRLTAAEVPLAAATTESDQAATDATVTDLRVVGQAPLPETPVNPAAPRPGPAAPRLTRESARPTAVRAGDFLTSPFVVPIGGPPGAGAWPQPGGGIAIPGQPRPAPPARLGPPRRSQPGRHVGPPGATAPGASLR